MAREVIVEKEVVPVENGDSTASNAIWAIALVIVVALIALAVWKSGLLNRLGTTPTQKVDVEVSAPGH